MSPFSLALTELHLAVRKAERRAAMAAPADRKLAAFMDPDVLHDLQVEVAGDLADALDRIEPGLGTRWMQAMHPAVEFSALGSGVPA